MADVPKEAIKDWHTVKPSSYAAFCVMCEVKDSREADVYLDRDKAAEYGIGKSAYYESFDDLEKENWIEFSRKYEGKKRWKLLKGFVQNPANVEKHNSANTENSTNAEKISVNYSVNAENSANTETQNSANVESPLHPPIRKISTKNKDTKNIVETSSTVVQKEPVELTNFRKTLASFQNAYAKPSTQGQAISQNKAIKKLFELARGDTMMCIEMHRFYQSETWRNGVVNWELVVKNFNYYGKKQNESIQRNSNGDYRDKRANEAINDHLAIEQLRAKRRTEPKLS